MEKNHPEILVVGATSRNLGKTTLVCRLISRFSHLPITAIKIKTLRDGDQAWHGSPANLEGRYLILEETGNDHLPDSARMRDAGARQVLYIKSGYPDLGDALEEALDKIPPGNLVVAESNSILRWLKPGIYVLIKGSDPSTYKPSALETEKDADIVIFSDGKAFSTDPADLPLTVAGEGWTVTGTNPATSGS